MKPILKRFRQKFDIYNQNLVLGRGTQVEILDIKGERTRLTGEDTMLITALVEISAVVTIWKDAVCSICALKVPTPGNSATQDDLWFILENHDGDRFVFPDEEDCKVERDRYPVEGWKKSKEGLTCPTCTLELREAALGVIERRKGINKP